MVVRHTGMPKCLSGSQEKLELFIDVCKSRPVLNNAKRMLVRIGKTGTK